MHASHLPVIVCTLITVFLPEMLIVSFAQSPKKLLLVPHFQDQEASRSLLWKYPGSSSCETSAELFQWKALSKNTLIYWPSGLPSMGSHRVGHDWSDLAAAAGSYQVMWGPTLFIFRNMRAETNQNKVKGYCVNPVIDWTVAESDLWLFQSIGSPSFYIYDMCILVSSILARKIPWTEEAGGLQSMGLQRVGHDWAHALFIPYYTIVIVESSLLLLAPFPIL